MRSASSKRVPTRKAGSRDRRSLSAFACDETASTAVEYCLIGSLVVMAMIGGLISFADETDGMWAFVRNAVTSAITG